MKRKPGTLLPIEVDILGAAIALFRGGEPDFYGYAIAREVQAQHPDSRLTAHGTLYRALERMQTAGLLTSHWEDPAVAASEQRPLRRLYRITAEGESAFEAASAAAPQTAVPLATRRKGVATP